MGRVSVCFILRTSKPAIGAPDFYIRAAKGAETHLATRALHKLAADAHMLPDFLFF